MQSAEITSTLFRSLSAVGSNASSFNDYSPLSFHRKLYNVIDWNRNIHFGTLPLEQM